MVVQPVSAPRSRRASNRAPGELCFEVAGTRIVSDFAFRDLVRAAGTAGAAGDALRVTRCEPSAIPAGAELVREVVDEAERYAFRTYADDRGWRWEVQGLGQFFIDVATLNITYALLPGACPSDVEHVLVGPVLGTALQLRGQPLLHAGAVVIDGVAAAITAPSGYGKSTLIAHLASRGLPVLSDDTLPIGLGAGGPFARPYVRKIKLWEDSLAALGGRPDEYERALSWLEKVRLPVGAQPIGPSETFPLRGIYILRPHVTPTDITIDRLDARSATFAMLGSMYLPELLHVRRTRAALDAAAALAAAGCVRELHYERSFGQLPAVGDAIVADVCAL
ncbi:MAG: hypothetical protein ACM3S1_12005 [Hyphomicrobiales bacterium]